MKQRKFLLLATLVAAVLGVTSLQPMAQDRSKITVTIVPASSEAARIPPALLAELKEAGEPFGEGKATKKKE